MDLNLPKMAYGIQKEEILWKEIKSKLSRMTIDKLLVPSSVDWISLS